MSLGNIGGITLGERQEINGILSPALSNAKINLIITDPEGNTEIKSVDTFSQGTYSLSFEPNSTGSWTITAIFGGNSFHKSASSNPFSFEVNEPFNLLFIIPVIIVSVFVIIIALRKKVMGSPKDEY